MPITPTYPGVYVEEIPSGVRTITGVATAIAAFVGWAPRGASDRAALISSFADFERQFGGLDVRSLLGYAVAQFFANGGQQAYIVRLVANDAAVAETTLGTTVKITAKSPGDWADNYGVRLIKRADAVTRFRVEVIHVNPQTTAETVVETFENLSMEAGDFRPVAGVINNESAFINAEAVGDKSQPADVTTTQKLAGGEPGAVLEPNTPEFEAALNPVNQQGGIYRLDRVDLFNMLVVPGETNNAALAALETFCRERRAFLIADCPSGATFTTLQNGPDGALTGADAVNAAFYFPWVTAADPLRQNRPRAFPPSAMIAGLFARTDTNRGVWKAPAGTEASLSGALGVERTLTDIENGVLNIRAINCIRNFPVYGTVAWGARTLHGSNERGSEWKYIPVRRTALYIEESLYRGLKWVVFEPNDEPLWAQIRLNVGAFLHNLFRQGAFQGRTPREAYFVKCDKETTTQTDINLGIVNIIVGFAPLKPAEFVILKLQQIAGQIES